jgi:hypothetical protein
MGVKSMVRELLRTGESEQLVELVAHERRAVRPLLARLWDPDAGIRRRAAEAVGRAAALHPDLGLEIIRNLMWALNDESATNGVYGLPALGEIGFWSPKLIEPFVQPIASLSWDDGLRPAILKALARIGEAAPDLIEPCLPLLHEGRVDGTCSNDKELGPANGQATGSIDGK